jgi:LPS-assembly lipoprotein
MMRRLVLTLAMLTLAGCGLRPLYGGGPANGVAATLRSVEVGPIGGQAGWLMRNKLIVRGIQRILRTKCRVVMRHP